MLDAVLDPFHRAAEFPAREPDQHDVGIDALFDAETAAARWRRDESQLMAAHAERIAHDRVKRVWPLEI